MSVHAVYGHDALLKRLGGAIATDRLPQSLLLLGPTGVGRQRIALWCAQALLCEKAPGDPCDTCRSCIQALGLAHPDIHWFLPLSLKKKSSDPDKQVDEVEAALADVLAERRQDPIVAPAEAGAGHSLASVRLLQRKVTRKPYQGRRKVIILVEAERLIVQDASQEAANALLKVLEEPPADTNLILTAGSLQRILPTIRSRVVPIRVRPVSDDSVRAFATEVLGRSGQALETAVAAAGGRIGALVSSVSSTTGDREAERLLTALRKSGARQIEAALAQAPWGARGSFTELLDALESRMRAEIERRATSGTGDLERALKALRIVEAKREVASRNVNPQLALAVMAQELEALR